MNPSPLRYPGGKHKLYKFVSETVTQNNCVTYVEPFCGGAAIALQLLFDGVVKDIIINDYDYTIFCFWDSILNQTDEFIRLIESTNISVEEWHKQKEIRKDTDLHSKLEVGFSTFFLNRTNRSGIIDKAGPIGGLSQTGNYSIDCRFNKEKLINSIKKIARYKKHIFVYNLEAKDFINNVITKKKKLFIFFDPPYYSKGPGLYKNFYKHEDHINLANTILKVLKRRKWIVTYDNTKAIRDMYNTIDFIQFELRYSLEKKRVANEIMFFSKGTERLTNESEYLNMI